MRNPHNPPDIAIKTLKVRGLRRSALKKEIRNEVAIMLNCGTHPNVVHLYGITHVPIRNVPHISILMGWAKYGSLRSYAKNEREKRIDHQDWQWFYRLAKGMACGLRHLHHRKILHHDISSNNVLVDAGGHARWTDFGLRSALIFDQLLRLGFANVPNRWNLSLKY